MEKRSKQLSSQTLSKMDTAYLGRMQSAGGMHEEAIRTLEKAIADPGTTKYAAYIHIFYVKALIAAGQPEHDSTSRARITRIAAGAHTATAADGRHTDRSPGPQQDQLAANVNRHRNVLLGQGGDSLWAQPIAVSNGGRTIYP